MKFIPHYLSILLFVSLAGCQKEAVYETAIDKLTNKVWYLEKLTSASYSYSYEGTATFSFKLEKATSFYHDSDGIVGDYLITESAQGIWIEVKGSARIIDSYKVTQLEKDHFVAEILKNNQLQVLYFSIRR